MRRRNDEATEMCDYRTRSSYASHTDFTGLDTLRRSFGITPSEPLVSIALMLRPLQEVEDLDVVCGMQSR